MDQKLKKILCESQYKPDSDLAENIWQKITAHDKRMVTLKLWGFSVLALFSLSGLVPAIQMLLGDFSKSGFYEYVSLAFSGMPSITTYWKEFAFSIAESLPLLSIVLSLTLVFIFFLSLRYIAKQIIKNQLSFSLKA